jgi:predicted RNA-binding protein with PUA-like domain
MSLLTGANETYRHKYTFGGHSLCALLLCSPKFPLICGMNHFLVKSEPFKYSWDKFNQEGRTFWDGVRNYQARNTMKEMKEGDLVLFYHSNEGKAVVGVAKVVKEFYQDPTTDNENWVVVDLVPVEPLKNPVTLEQIKAEQSLKDISLVRQGRLSVMKLKNTEFEKILEMSM